MTPPRICPPPPDCPLYAQRLDYGPDELLRRAILTEKKRPSLGELVWADFNRAYERPPSPSPVTSPTHPALPPSPGPAPLPISEAIKEGITP